MKNAVPPDRRRGRPRFDWYIVPPSSAMFRRRVVETVGGFRDPWGADDLDFYLRVARSHRAWCFQSPAVTRYRRYSASSSRDGERMLASVRAVYARQQHVAERDPEALAAWLYGLRRLTDIFVDCSKRTYATACGCATGTARSEAHASWLPRARSDGTRYARNWSGTRIACLKVRESVTANRDVREN